MTTAHRSSRTSEDGSVLVMALVFLSLFSLAVAAALSFAQTGFKTADAVHTTTKTQYAADAGIEGAINAIRGDTSIGKDPFNASCFSLPAQVNSLAVSVDCTARTGSGSGGGGGGTVPANSVLTLPANASEGIVVSAGGAPVVSGNAITNQTRIVPAGATLTVQGSLTCKAVSGTGTVTATTTSCPAAVAPAATDPAYAAAIANVPAAAAMPVCAAGATVTFAPGTYTSAAALNALMNGTCANKRFLFTPGAYYFEFADSLPSGTHQWLINDVTAEVVGGTLTATAFPSRCDATAAGVQFIFGADSRMAVTAGSLELCPPLGAGQRIAVYGGAADSADIVVPLTTVTPTTATTTPVAGEPSTYTPTANAVSIGDGLEAKFSASVNKGAAILNFSGFAAAAIPANAVITSAKVRVASRSENLPANNTPTLTLVAGDGTSVAYQANPCALPCAIGTTTTIDVLAQINSPARANGVTMAFRADDRQGIPYYVSYVDGVALDIAYKIPGIKGTSTAGCMAAVPYNPATVTTTCPVLRGTGAGAKLAIKGTVYAPIGAVDLSVTGQLNAVTQRGIIARTLQLGLTRGAAYTGALLSLPGAGPRYVLLTAKIGGVPKLRADVTIDDALGATPGATVTVTSWSVLR